MSSVSLQNIKKIYPGNVTAVHDFNLEISDGEFVVFVGPSGCGKSTTLRMIAGLEDISDGELKIGGRRANELSPKDRNIAMVFQSYALYPHKSVYKNLSFALELQKLPKAEIEEKVIKAAEILGLTEYLDRKPKALSGGQRQRVALGRALVRNPGVFLLDEPLSNLDAKLRTTMRTQIKLLHNRLGTTFIYVTHDQVEAMTMGDRIVVMRDGVIQQVDTPQHLYRKPCNTFVAGFIGTPQMNFLTCTVGEDGTELRFPAGTLKLQNDCVPKSLNDYIGKEITVGIRPESVCVGTVNDESEDFKAAVEEVQPNGSEMLVRLLWGKSRITAKVSAGVPVHTGDWVKVGFKAERLHFFDSQSEERID